MEPGVRRGVLHEFLLINWVEMTHCRTHCRKHAGRIAERIAGAIAGHTARTHFDLSTGQLSEEHRWELASDGAEWLQGACGCFDREFESGVFAMGKWLRIACFLTSVFLIINVFPHFSRKKESSNFSTRVLNPPFQYLSQISKAPLNPSLTSLIRFNLYTCSHGLTEEFLFKAYFISDICEVIGS